MRLIFAGFLVMGIAVLAAHALDGKNGYSATALFTADDVVTQVTYDASFGGVEWGDLDGFHLGISGQRNLAVASDGTLYVLVGATDQSANAAYTGIVESDGSGFLNLVQDEKVSDSSGEFIRGAVVSPVTAGGLTAGHLVLWRSSRATATAQTYLEIWSMDPADSSESLIYSWPSATNPRGVLVIDGSGNLFFLSQGLQDGSGNSLDGTIRKLVWNGTDYDESSLTSTGVSTDLAIDANGDLYTFPEFPLFGAAGESVDIHVIDPDTGSSSVHATVAANHLFDQWSFDSAGVLWIGLRQTTGPARKRIQYLTEVPADGTTSKGDRVAEYGTIDGVASGSSQKLYVLESDLSDGLGDTVYELTPGSGGGGGGKGGGKGKNK